MAVFFGSNRCSGLAAVDPMFRAARLRNVEPLIDRASGTSGAFLFAVVVRNRLNSRNSQPVAPSMFLNPTKKELHTLLHRVDMRVAACAAVAGAAAGLPAAQAGIVWSGFVNINVPSTTSGIYLNVVTGVFGATPASSPGWDLNPWSSTAFNVWANNAASQDDGVISNFAGGTSATLTDNLPFDATINGTYTFGRSNSSETTGATAFLLNSSNNYIGFRFLNEATGQLNYGWAHFSLGSTFGGQPRTLIDFAYENTGAPCSLPIPEPSTISLLAIVAMGAIGLRVWRARKAA
jgi:hypothetical protein